MALRSTPYGVCWIRHAWAHPYFEIKCSGYVYEPRLGKRAIQITWNALFFQPCLSTLEYIIAMWSMILMITDNYLCILYKIKKSSGICKQ